MYILIKITIYRMFLSQNYKIEWLKILKTFLKCFNLDTYKCIVSKLWKLIVDSLTLEAYWVLTKLKFNKNNF